jgi:hypothetical protein
MPLVSPDGSPRWHFAHFFVEAAPSGIAVGTPLPPAGADDLRRGDPGSLSYRSRTEHRRGGLRNM